MYLTSTQTSLLFKIWLILAGFITTVVVTFYFNSIDQGYFYSFFSLVMANTLVELGFYQLILHRISPLRLGCKVSNGTIIGNKKNIDEIQSIGHLVLKWDLFSSLFLFILLMILGHILIFNKDSGNESVIWNIIVIFVVLNFFINPINIFLQSLGKLKTVYKFKFVQSFFAFFLFWILCINGFGLKSLLIYFFLQTIFIYSLFFIYYRKFIIKIFFLSKNIKKLKPHNITPTQIKIAITSISNYLHLIFPPALIFYLNGPIYSGKLGITLTIMNGLLVLSLALVEPLSSKLGYFAAKGKIKYSIRIMRKLLMNILFLGLLYLFGIFLLFEIISYFFANYEHKFLLIKDTLLIGLGFLIVSASQPFISFIRSLKTEPFFYVNFIQSIIYLLIIVTLNFYNLISLLPLYFVISVIPSFLYIIYLFNNYKNVTP